MSSKKKAKPVYEEYTFGGHSTDTGHVLGVDFTENPEQRELIRLIYQNKLPIVFCFGKAGTRKNICNTNSSTLISKSPT